MPGGGGSNLKGVYARGGSNLKGVSARGLSILGDFQGFSIQYEVYSHGKGRGNSRELPFKEDQFEEGQFKGVPINERYA